jgi:hypothetical protein
MYKLRVEHDSSAITENKIVYSTTNKNIIATCSELIIITF